MTLIPPLPVPPRKPKNGPVDISTIIFLVIAVLIFLRLRSVLGRRTGNERPPLDPFSRRTPTRGAAPGSNDKVIDLPPRRAAVTPAEPVIRLAAPANDPLKVIAPVGSTLHDSLTAVAAVDPKFKPDGFIDGARTAYEHIVTAFAEGDRSCAEAAPFTA